MEENQNETLEQSTLIPQDIIQIEDGVPCTTSLIVAQAFEKEHKNVLQSIKNLECSTQFNQLNFQPVEYKDAKGEMRPAFSMTRDGFAFLAMGFTGKKAAIWKEHFLEAFNAMERTVLEQQAVLEEALKRRREQQDSVSQEYGARRSLFRAIRKLSRSQAEGLAGIIRMESFLQQRSSEEITQELLTFYHLERLEDLRQEDFQAVVEIIVKRMFLPGKREADEKRAASCRDAVEGLIDFWNISTQFSRSDIHAYVQNKCGVSVKENSFSDQEALKVLFALWGGIAHHAL